MRSRLGWTTSYKSLYFVHRSFEVVPLLTRMRERSISKTTTLHVHHTFLPFFHDYDLKMPNFAFCGKRKQGTTKFFYFSFWTCIVPWNSNSEGVAYIWQSKWVGIIAIKAEGTQIHFLSDVLVAVVSLDLKVPILFKGDVTRDDSQQRFLAQHSVTALLQHCSNTATLCCAENR